jgi:hypothetical protein
MHPRPHVSFITAMRTALFLCAATAPLLAQDLPPARELVERHLEAIGGREVLAGVQSVNARGSFEMPAMGLRGELLAAQSSTGAVLTRIVIGGLGDIVTGYDGEVAWATNPMIGPRLLQGAELAQITDDGSFLSALRQPPAVRTIETVGTAEVDGERCYRVRVRWASGRQSHDCYSAASGLLIGKELTQLSPTGALDVTVVYSEYREFGPLRMPAVTTQRAAGQQQVLRLVEVEFDTVAPETFEPPPEVRVLIQRQRSGGSR